jgi:hypothetical protein
MLGTSSNSDTPIRPMLCAGGVYPKSPTTLRRELNHYLTSISNLQSPISFPRALITPHIDFARGGAIYASVWQAVAEAAKQADLVIIFGTDHRGTGQMFTLTDADYATPYGTLPTARALNTTIAQAIGPQRAYDAEQFHTIEHSIELPLVWLHHMREGRPVEVLPIIVGGLWQELLCKRSPVSNAQVGAFLDALKSATQGRNVFVIASGDLSHVGPAFDGPPLTAADKQALTQYDQAILQHVIDGDAECWFETLAETQNATNVCGLVPVYLALKLLESTQPTRGEITGYGVCPADGQNTSVVSICGAVLS